MGVSLASGHFLNAIARRYPEAVLGAQAAQVLQITHVAGHLLIDLGNTWFTVVGILRPILLDSTLDSNVYISLPVAERMFRRQGQSLGDLPAGQRQPRGRCQRACWRRPPTLSNPRG